MAVCEGGGGGGGEERRLLMENSALFIFVTVKKNVHLGKHRFQMLSVSETKQ